VGRRKNGVPGNAASISRTPQKEKTIAERGKTDVTDEEEPKREKGANANSDLKGGGEERIGMCLLKREIGSVSTARKLTRYFGLYHRRRRLRQGERKKQRREEGERPNICDPGGDGKE